MYPVRHSQSSPRRLAACFLAFFVPPLASLAIAPAARAAPPETGVWIDHNGQGAVEIKPCGQKLCGHIFWLKDTKNSKGQPLIDIYNPDTSKRKRPICGLPVVGNLQKQAGGGWDAGWIYDPKEGKSYDLEVRAASRDRLTVTGYMGTKFFSKTMTWTRAPASLVRCGTSPKTDAVAKSSPEPKVQKDGAKQPPPKASAAAAPAKPRIRPSADVRPAQAAAGPTLPSQLEPVREAKADAGPGDEAVAPRENSEPVLISGPALATRNTLPGKAGLSGPPPAEQDNVTPPPRLNFYPAPP